MFWYQLPYFPLTQYRPATSLYISPRVEAPDAAQLKPEKVNFDGKDYIATPLSYGDQGAFSHAFRIEGGFQADGGKPIPAILKRVFEKQGSDNPNSKTLKEIGFLKRVRLSRDMLVQDRTN